MAVYEPGIVVATPHGNNDEDSLYVHKQGHAFIWEHDRSRWFFEQALKEQHE